MRKAAICVMQVAAFFILTNYLSINYSKCINLFYLFFPSLSEEMNIISIG